MENKNKLLNLFKEMNVVYKYALGALLIVLITGTSFFFMKDDGYTVLYQNLNENDKTEILNEMQKMGVSYTESENGSINVKENDVNWVRNELTDMGLPSQSSYSYENFFDSSLGTTQSEKDLRELASRKGQLESDILSNFTNIEKVSVQLVLPETGSIFDVEAEGGSASVLINQKGEDLTSQQVSGLQHMVATAVPGIDAEEVKIIDSEIGVISLSSEQQKEMNSDFEKQLEIVSKTEKETTTKIRNSLTNFFGQENIEISVNMSINFDEIEQQIETYGDKGTLRSTQRDSELISKNEGTDLPEAGVEDGGDVTTYENIEDAGDNYSSETSKVIENFEINKTVETIKKHPELTNTNIVVWVDRTKMREKGINEGDFSDSIAIAAGLTIAEDGTYENGQVSVMLIDKEKAPVVEEEKEEEATGIAAFFEKNIVALIAVISVIIIILIAMLILLSKRNKKVMQLELERIEREEEEERLRNEEANVVVVEKKEVEQARNQLRKLNPQPYGLEEMSDGEVLQLLEEKHGEILEIEKNKQLQELITKEKNEMREKKMKEVEEQIEKLGSEYPSETAEYLRQLLR